MINTVKRRMPLLFVFAAIICSYAFVHTVFAAETLTTGKPAQCMLTNANGLQAEYTVSPAETGTYKFVTAGVAGDIFMKLYDAGGNYLNGDSGDVFAYFNCDLSSGETYTLRVTGEAEQIFAVGMLKDGAGQVITNNAGLQLTDARKTVRLEYVSENSPGEVRWKCSDPSVVEFGVWSGWSVGKGITAECMDVIAKKNGSARVTLTRYPDGSTLAVFDLVCSDVTEYYPLYVGNVQVNSRNASAITGEGISGAISYSSATHTLSLNNAVIKKAGFTYGNDGYPVCAIGYGGTDTLTIKLTGNNKITDVDYDATNPNNKYDSSLFYSGISGICSNGSVHISGAGSLQISDGRIGTAVSGDGSVTIDQGCSVGITMTNVNNSRGVCAGDTVTVNGNLTVNGRTYTIVVDGRAGGITGYGITAKKLVVGNSGTVDVTEATGNSTTSYAVALSAGGSAVINGTLKAKAEGGSGLSAGVAIRAADGNTPLTVGEKGKIILQGAWKALLNIQIKPGTGIALIAGSDKNSAVKTEPSGISLQKYIESVPASSVSSAPSSSSASSGSQASGQSKTDGTPASAAAANPVTPQSESKKAEVPSAKAQEKAILSLKSDSDPKGSTYGLLQARMKKAAKNSITLQWKKIKGAKYTVYGNKCGKKNKYKKIKTITKTSFTQKKLKKGTYYKYLIVAVKDGKAVATSRTIHVATTGGKVGNTKTVKAAKSKLSVKIGKTAKIKYTTQPASKKLPVKSHRAVAFESSNANIATVSKKGVVKGIRKGTCYVYAYAQNGVMAKITVKVG